MKQRLRARFRLAIVGQVIVLVAVSLVFAYTAISTGFLAVPIVLGAIIALQVYALVKSVEKHVDTLEDFFAAINYEDFTRHFVTDDVDAELKAAFNRIIDRFRDARAERDVQAEYLETIVRHVPVPLMAVRGDGSMRLVNSPLKRMTGLATIRKLEDFAGLDPGLPGRISAIGAGEQRLVQARFHDVPVELRVSVAEIRLEGETERIYSIENISGELSARESSAWRNLIRVLTHEIMNTLTPVASLAETSEQIASESDAPAEIRDAVATIARRSRGLIHFVERYRELMQLPSPRPESVVLADALGAVVRLMQDDLEGIAVSVDVSPASLSVQADPALLDQVLVNLVRNAAQAMAGRKNSTLALTGKLEYGRTLVQVRDNGPGIADDLLDQVFVPFFTTRRGGSGIGLSVSRQIMMAHGGELVAASTPGGTTMTLLF